MSNQHNFKARTLLSIPDIPKLSSQSLAKIDTNLSLQLDFTQYPYGFIELIHSTVGGNGVQTSLTFVPIGDSWWWGCSNKCMMLCVESSVLVIGLLVVGNDVDMVSIVEVNFVGMVEVNIFIGVDCVVVVVSSLPSFSSGY